MSGKPLAPLPPYGYRKCDTDKTKWVIDEESAAVVRRIFQMFIDGYGVCKIARILSEEKILIPAAYAKIKYNRPIRGYEDQYKWCVNTITRMLEVVEYTGKLANFKSVRKSYKCKKRSKTSKDEWMVFENTHEPIISQHDFDIVQEMRANRRRPQKFEEVSPYSGVVFCGECGRRLDICRSRSKSFGQEHMKCSRYAHHPDACTSHYIRTFVLSKVILSELNKIITLVRDDEEKFVHDVMESYQLTHSDEANKAKKVIAKNSKRIEELDRLFMNLYEDKALGNLSPDRYLQMSTAYEEEQQKLRKESDELIRFIEEKEKKCEDISQFLAIVRKFENVTEINIRVMSELIDRVDVHEVDKSKGYRTQKIDIHFKFNVVTVSSDLDMRTFNKCNRLYSA